MNVGYAFVNFVSPGDILTLSFHMRGKRWANSHKVAELSYATSQGVDILVEKFRNSCVMQEVPASRPRLFYTEPSPYAGIEMAFPAPNNSSRQERSRQNAQHIGLYAKPSAHPGHATRGSQTSPTRAGQTAYFGGVGRV
ncbi:MAG: hypothetical protein M1828_006366 [Chrysothrix sp. TS-e1954]|nr:MAG: hypothetical protein M1828_006366 [Chrysothrix sp. TS-e1954]